MSIPAYGSTIFVVGYKLVRGILFFFFARHNLTRDMSSEDTLIKLGQTLSRLSIPKDSLGWDLVALERMVQTVKEGQPDSDDEDLELERPAPL